MPLLPFFCTLTPAGPGAVAVIEVRLADSNEVVDVMRKFQSGSALSVADAPEGRILFGSWDGEDVVVVKTGDHSWEIHCHGGAVAISRICHDLEAAGISYGKQLHLTDESLAQRITRITNSTLMKCRTRKVAGLVLAQQDGRLLRLAEDLQSGCGDNRHKAEEHLRRWQSVAKHLTRPWRVAIVGEPNVGKSSLINAMAGLQRSIVSAVPGTTRDQVEVDIVIRGWMFRLIDTAGVRGEADSLPEQLGIVQSLALIEDCDLICLVIEATSPGFESALVERLKNVCTPICIVRNKCDLPRDSEETGNSMFAMNLDYVDAIAGTINVSAKTGLGISELLDWIAETAIPEEPGPETALPLVELFGTV